MKDKKTNVPFIDDKNEVFASCQGPHSAIMVFLALKPNEHMSFQRFYKEIRYTHKTWFFETYIAEFFHRKHIPVKYISTVDLELIGNNLKKIKDDYGIDIMDKTALDAFDTERYDEGVEYTIKNDLFKKSNIDLDLIKKNLDNDKLIIATTNRNSLQGLKGYKGHFLVVMDYDDNAFICNDSYLGENIKIKFNIFEKALFNEDKTEADIIVVG